MRIKEVRAKSFVTIMIVIALSALLLRITIEQVMRLTISQNESNALSTLKLISTSLENYAKDRQGHYPTNLTFLTSATPPYLDKDYITKFPVRGYTFNCARLGETGYSCVAQPTKCRLTANQVYTVTTGGSLTDEDCFKKD